MVQGKTRTGLPGAAQAARRHSASQRQRRHKHRMNGLELATALRQHAVSRHTEKHRELALRAGVDCFLTKPYGEEELLATIHALLQRQAA